jgi:hypothetical protein
MYKQTSNKLPAKTCYSHIGGRLGLLLFEKFVEKGWIEKENSKAKHFYITDKGQKEFSKLGIGLTLIKKE